MASFEERRDACPGFVRLLLLAAIFVIPLFGLSSALRTFLVKAYGSTFPYSYGISYGLAVIGIAAILLPVMLVVGQLVISRRTEQEPQGIEG